MRRVLVIGSPGAGKSTLATRLAAALGLPVHYLDLHHWKPGWQYRETAEARERVRAIVETPAWVMDGNFAETFDLRMPRADTLVWLDYPRGTCVRRILLRTHQGSWQAEARSARRVSGKIRRQRVALCLEISRRRAGRRSSPRWSAMAAT